MMVLRIITSDFPGIKINSLLKTPFEFLILLKVDFIFFEASFKY